MLDSDRRSEKAMSEREKPSTAPNLVQVSAYSTSPLPVWIVLVVTLGALLMAVGAVLALVHPSMLVSPHDEINAAVRVYAGYLVSRNMAIALVLVLLLLLRAKRALSHLMILVALIQIFDGVLDCVEGRWMIAPGVLLFGVIFLVAATRLSGYPFWRSSAWRQ
jgi:hypothetical protein